MAAEIKMEPESTWDRQSPGSAARHLYLARRLTILGHEDKALERLEKLIDEDYRGNPFRNFLDENLIFALYHDPILSTIRDHPRFQALVTEVEADLAQQLENVREMERSGELPTLAELRTKIESEYQNPVIPGH